MKNNTYSNQGKRNSNTNKENNSHTLNSNINKKKDKQQSKRTELDCPNETRINKIQKYREHLHYITNRPRCSLGKKGSNEALQIQKVNSSNRKTLCSRIKPNKKEEFKEQINETTNNLNSSSQSLFSTTKSLLSLENFNKSKTNLISEFHKTKTHRKDQKTAINSKSTKEQEGWTKIEKENNRFKRLFKSLLFFSPEVVVNRNDSLRSKEALSNKKVNKQRIISRNQSIAFTFRSKSVENFKKQVEIKEEENFYEIDDSLISYSGTHEQQLVKLENKSTEKTNSNIKSFNLNLSNLSGILNKDTSNYSNKFELEENFSVKSCLTFVDDCLAHKEVCRSKDHLLSSFSMPSQCNCSNKRQIKLEKMPSSLSYRHPSESLDQSIDKNGKTSTLSAYAKSFIISTPTRTRKFLSKSFFKREHNNNISVTATESKNNKLEAVSKDKNHYQLVPPSYKPPPPAQFLSNHVTSASTHDFNKQSRKFSNSQMTSEYSEPFDLIKGNQNEAEKTGNGIKMVVSKQPETDSSSFLKCLSNNENCKQISTTPLITKKIKESITRLIDDDSAYSSCNISQPYEKPFRAINKVCSANKIDLLDTEEESTFDMCTLIPSSSSTSSSSPILKSNSSIRMTHTPSFNLSHSESSNYTKNLNKTAISMISEYETVQDALPTVKASKESESDLFKSTITAFDVLSERCSNLLKLFDNKKNDESKKHNTKQNSNDSSVQESSIQPFPMFRHNNSVFLDRTLTFNDYLNSSVLLSSSNTDKENVNKNRFHLIRNYIFNLSKNEKTLLGKSINEFITCSTSSNDIKSNALIRNTRQFLNGLKNYLLIIDNSEINQLIEKERANLKLGEILNVDSIIEDCLQAIILRPLKAKIYYLLVDELITNKSLVTISKNINFLNNLDETSSMNYLAVSKKENLPSSNTLNLIQNCYNRMQCEYAPLMKLKYILLIVNELLMEISDFKIAINDLVYLNVVEFMSVLIYTISKCKMNALQIEIDYIWNLVNKKLLTNETIYYLTVMSSACYVLRTLDTSLERIDFKNGLIDVYFLDDKLQTIRIKTIPINPISNCKEVASLIAAKFKVYNSHDYGLFLIENGLETQIKDDDLLLDLKNNRFSSISKTKFFYKQKNIKILLPKAIETN